MSDHPIRIVVVHYGDHTLTLACIDRLLAVGRPVDIVVVDNGGGPPLRGSLNDVHAAVSVLVGGPDLGFGGGANLGLANRSDAELIALVNNDVLVEPGWLDPLVAALDDPTVGAAAPKILLHDRFRNLTLEVDTTDGGRLDRRRLGLRILGARAGEVDLTERIRYPEGTWGPEWDDDGRTERWTAGATHLLVPELGTGSVELELLIASPAPTVATFTADGEITEVKVSTEPVWHRVSVPGPVVDVLHNAGTSVDRDGYGTDRGFLSADGPRWSRSEDVFAWCGAAVLMRTSYLDDVGLFDPDLFLYYEDVELSWRGHECGWRYRYVPDSVVRHVHSATTGQDPVGTLGLNERNRLLVLARHAAPRRTLRAVARTVAVTASYAARDIMHPLLEHAPIRRHHSVARVRALAGFAARLPRVRAQRRHDERARTSR